MRILLSFLIALSSVCSAASFSQNKPTYPTLASTSPTVRAFLGSCSGLLVQEEIDVLVAHSNCMGRVRGYADGHQITMQMYKRAVDDYQKEKRTAAPTIPNFRMMWCLPADKTDGEVINSITKWIDSNEKEAKRMLSAYPGLYGATAIITVALSQLYSCPKGKVHYG